MKFANMQYRKLALLVVLLVVSFSIQIQEVEENTEDADRSKGKKFKISRNKVKKSAKKASIKSETSNAKKSLRGGSTQESEAPAPAPPAGNQSDLKVLNSETLPEIWKTLFTTTARPTKMCQVADNVKFIYDLKQLEIIENSLSVPKEKLNVFYKPWGYEDSGYLFDYIDYLFQKEIAGIFKQFYGACLNTAPDNNIVDDYSIKNQLNAYYTQTPGILDGPPNKNGTDEELSVLLRKYNPKFNYPLYKNSIKIPQLATIVKQHKWRFVDIKVDWAKKLLDKYDFNGDGALDAKEFLFLAIWENRDDLNSETRKLPFAKIINEKIDPIFYYLDCNADGLIGSENIWHGLRFLNKDPVQAAKFNMFKCKVNGLEYRTNSAGDFVLKNRHKYNGQLTKEDFQRGIILGYWDRQVSDNDIIATDVKSLKETRWTRGEIDIECDRLVKYQV